MDFTKALPKRQLSSKYLKQGYDFICVFFQKLTYL